MVLCLIRGDIQKVNDLQGWGRRNWHTHPFVQFSVLIDYKTTFKGSRYYAILAFDKWLLVSVFDFTKHNSDLRENQMWIFF